MDMDQFYCFFFFFENMASMRRVTINSPNMLTEASTTAKKPHSFDIDISAGPAPNAPRPPTGELPTGETVVEGLLQFIGQARRELLIISPYFVPGPEIKKAFADARARGVRIRVLTNSLASNDAPIAHVGYARHRDEMLGMGLELYEMRSEQATLGSALGTSGAGVTGESRAMLHSKVLVLDGRLLVVGSMNLDLRSQEQNTEIALLIRSTALSKEATDLIETSLREGAWRISRRVVIPRHTDRTEQ